MGHGTHGEFIDMLYQSGIEEDEIDGFEDFAVDEDGNWRISDYALDKLIGLAIDILGSDDSDKKLVVIDKLLNVVHARSDLSSWFVRGGQSTLNQLANESCVSQIKLEEVMDEDVPLSMLQQRMKDRYPAAKKSDMYKGSRYPGEEDLIKFWILNDGTSIHVPYAHAKLLEELPGKFRMGDLLDDGAVRVASEPYGELFLNYNGDPTGAQISAVLGIVRLHDSVVVMYELEDDSGKFSIQSYDDVSRFMKTGWAPKRSLVAQFHESVDGSSNNLPDVQQHIKDVGVLANKSNMFRTSAGMGEFEFVKFWLLNDGSAIWVPGSHFDFDKKKRLNSNEYYDEVLRTGAVRVSVDIEQSVPYLDYEGDLIVSQIRWIVELARLHDVDEVVFEDRDKEGYTYVVSPKVKLSSSSQLSSILRNRGRANNQSLVAQFHESLEEAMEEDMTKLREDLKPSLTRLFEGDPFHLIERDALLWKSRFGVDRYLTAGAPLVSIEKKVRDLQKLAGTLLQKYGNDRGYLEMIIEAMSEREPLNSFDGFKSNDYLYGTRMYSSHEGIEMVFEAALDPLYNVSETVYVGDTEVLDRWAELAGGIKIVGNVAYPKGERFTPGLLQLLEHAIIDTIDASDKFEAEEEME
jgi:hypothetical protein